MRSLYFKSNKEILLALKIQKFFFKKKEALFLEFESNIDRDQKNQLLKKFATFSERLFLIEEKKNINHFLKNAFHQTCLKWFLRSHQDYHLDVMARSKISLERQFDQGEKLITLIREHDLIALEIVLETMNSDLLFSMLSLIENEKLEYVLITPLCSTFYETDLKFKNVLINFKNKVNLFFNPSHPVSMFLEN